MSIYTDHKQMIIEYSINDLINFKMSDRSHQEHTQWEHTMFFIQWRGRVPNYYPSYIYFSPINYSMRVWYILTHFNEDTKLIISKCTSIFQDNFLSTTAKIHLNCNCVQTLTAVSQHYIAILIITWVGGSMCSVHCVPCAGSFSAAFAKCLWPLVTCIATDLSESVTLYTLVTWLRPENTNSQWAVVEIFLYTNASSWSQLTFIGLLTQ